MQSPVKSALAGLAGLMIAVSTVAPANAVMLVPPVGVKMQKAEEVQYRRDRFRHGYYNGYHGYRGYREGYRRHSDGWWYPLAAFGAGAVIGGAIANGNNGHRARSYNYDNRHYQWCADRYRTYRPSDNTYVLRAGVRAQCNSPYSG